jgi:acyl-CoA reductase-like NAD-dependent aldehyde dehydrogenase
VLTASSLCNTSALVTPIEQRYGGPANAAAAVMGDGFKEGVEFGPLNNIMQFNKVKGIVEDAKKDGARIVTGGQPTPGSSGYFYEPTIIADVSRAFPSWNLGPY